MKTISFSLIQDIHQAEDALSRQFLALLEQERHAIIDKQFDELSLIIKEKNALILKLQTAAETRNHCLNQAGKSKVSTWSEFISSLNVPKLIDQWAEIKSTLTACHKDNTINGQLISRSHQVCTQLLLLIRGNTSKTPAVYTARGNTTNNHYSQSVAKA